jgi:hypothetical protein
MLAPRIPDLHLSFIGRPFDLRGTLQQDACPCAASSLFPNILLRPLLWVPPDVLFRAPSFLGGVNLGFQPCQQIFFHFLLCGFDFSLYFLSVALCFGTHPGQHFLNMHFII